MEIKVKVILWTYKSLSNEEYEIRLRLTSYKDVKYLGLGYSSPKDHWDCKNEIPRITHPKFKEIIKEIERLKEEADFEIKLARKSNISLTPSELRLKLKKNKKVSNYKILEYFDKVVADLEKEGRIGYSNVFKNCRGIVSNFLKSVDKSLSAFSKNDCENFEKYLLENVNKSSSVSHYLRTFYRLWNIAIANDICSKEQHPSNYIKFKVYKKFKTRKRAIAFEQIKAIEQLNLDPSSRLFRSQQYFLFSYYARGINFIDLAQLKDKVNLKGNELYYIRSKNKREYQFTLHSKAFAIVEYFNSYPMKSDAGYIFPILTSKHDTPKKIDTRIDSALKDLNEDLRAIAKIVGLNKDLTSYVARHSFATNLRNKKVDVGIIQEALGHETELQTATYLDEIDDSIVAASIENALK